MNQLIHKPFDHFQCKKIILEAQNSVQVIGWQKFSSMYEKIINYSCPAMEQACSKSRVCPKLCPFPWAVTEGSASQMGIRCSWLLQIPTMLWFPLLFEFLSCAFSFLTEATISHVSPLPWKSILISILTYEQVLLQQNKSPAAHSFILTAPPHSHNPGPGEQERKGPKCSYITNTIHPYVTDTIHRYMYFFLLHSVFQWYWHIGTFIFMTSKMMIRGMIQMWLIFCFCSLKSSW